MLNDPWNMHSRTALFGESLYDKFREAFRDFCTSLAFDLVAKLGAAEKETDPAWWSGEAIKGPVNQISGHIELRKGAEQITLSLGLDGSLHVQALVYSKGPSGNKKFKTSWDSFTSRVADHLVDEMKKNNFAI